MVTCELRYESLVHNANPLGRWGLRSSAPDGCADFRREFNGTLHFIDEDFKFLRNIETADPFAEIEIYLKDGNIEWLGAFSVAICEVDLYDGVIRVTPYIKDKYTNILQNWQKADDVFNGLIEKTKFGINEFSNFEYKTFTWDVELRRFFDYEIENNNCRIFRNAVNGDKVYWNEANKDKTLSIYRGNSYNYFIPSLFEGDVLFTEGFPNISLDYASTGMLWTDQWLIYKKEFLINRIVNSTEGYESRIYATMTIHLVREAITTFNDVNGYPVPPTGTLSDTLARGSSYNQHGLYIPAESTSAKWHYEYTTASEIDGKYVTKWHLKAKYFAENYLFKSMFYRGAIPVGSINNVRFEFKNQTAIKYYCATLENVINAYLFKYDSSLTLQTPIFKTHTEYNNLYLLSNEEFADEFKFTQINLEFKNLITSICNLFNKKWDIIDNKFIIDDLENFNDSSYVDLVTGPNYEYIRNKKLYKYSGNMVPKQEELQLQDKSSTLDFNGFPIIYKSISSSGGNEDNKLSIPVSAFGVDLDLVAKESKTDGFTLIMLSIADGFNIYTENETFDETIIGTFSLKPIMRESLIVKEKLINEPLTKTRIMDLFHRKNKALPGGELNLEQVNFTNSGYIKEQSDLALQSDLTFRMFDKFKTELGIGKVESFEYDSVQKITKINIKLQ